MAEHTLSIAGSTRPTTILVSEKKPLFILGRNGTGKSALMQHLRSQLGQLTAYMPGSRPSYFDNESLSITPASRKDMTANFQVWDSRPDIRWRSLSGTTRNERAIHDLTASETQFKIDAANQIAAEGRESAAIARLQAGDAPLDIVNGLLAQANLPVRVCITSAELRALRDGAEFSIAKMSDGERIALVLVAEVVAAKPGTVFIIDEPEIHLHRSIVVPLVAALIRQRKDCSFVVGTHELELPAEISGATIAIVRDAHWQGDAIQSWDLDVLAPSDGIPESLRLDILGSRRKILFIEGTPTSLDAPLYALLFPDVSVRSRESCLEVERAVVGLRATEDTHHAKAFGLVDDDGMSPEQSDALRAKSVFAIPAYSVESLYYSPSVIEALATRQSETLGIDKDEMLATVCDRGLQAVDSGSTKSHLASRLAERQLRDKLMQHAPTASALVSAENSQAITLSLESTYAPELERITQLRTQNNLEAIVRRYPVRESGILKAIAEALRFSERSDYERAALARVAVDADLRRSLELELGALATELNS